MNERERIEHIISAYGLSSSQFAEKTAIPRASVSHILSGRNKPSLEVLQKVAAAFPDVDVNWLMLGVGDAPSLVLAHNEVGGVSVGAMLFSELNNDVSAVQESVVQAKPVEAVRNIREEKVKSVRNNNILRNTSAAESRSTKRGTQRANIENGKYIKEVRVFYSDGTYEILYPEK